MGLLFFKWLKRRKLSVDIRQPLILHPTVLLSSSSSSSKTSISLSWLQSLRHAPASLTRRRRAPPPRPGPTVIFRRPARRRHRRLSLHHRQAGLLPPPGTSSKSGGHGGRQVPVKIQTANSAARVDWKFARFQSTEAEGNCIIIW
jgi:hypothetical protein